MIHYPVLVGLVGYKNSGKTYVMERLFERIGGGCNRIGFSEPLYDMLGVLGVHKEEFQEKEKRDVPHPLLCGKTLQEALNSLGTSWGRKMIGEHLWLQTSMRKVRRDCVNVADNVRFPNEFDEVRKRGGFLVHVRNDSVFCDHTEPEKHVDSLSNLCDATIVNDRKKDIGPEIDELLRRMRLFVSAH